MPRGRKPEPKRRPARTPRPARTFGVYRPAERLIYQYWDGQTDRKGDPLELFRRLTTYDGLALDVDAQLALGETREAPKALTRVIGAVRDVFRVKPMDEGGLPEAECLGLLLHFMTFIAGVQRDLAPLPTSPPPTDCPAANGSTTGPSAASGSTASGR